jgi:hypothetical protein
MKTREVTVKDLTGADIPALLLVCPECWRETPESLEAENELRIEWAKRDGWQFIDGPEGSHYIVFSHPGRHARGLRFFTNGKPEDTSDRLTVGGVPVFQPTRGESFHLYVVGATDADPMGHNHLQCTSCNVSFCQGGCDK